jgi:hypothetical protein
MIAMSFNQLLTLDDGLACGSVLGSVRAAYVRRVREMVRSLPVGKAERNLETGRLDFWLATSAQGWSDGRATVRPQSCM